MYIQRKIDVELLAWPGKLENQQQLGTCLSNLTSSKADWESFLFVYSSKSLQAVVSNWSIKTKRTHK